jgi:uncharacterized protein YkwD
MKTKQLPLVIVLALGLARPTFADDPPRLSLDEARQYMLELINRDRAVEKLPPVALDEIANSAAQKHAEEMAQNVYLSHYNLAGKKPDQRYTEAGGSDSVGENTYYWMWWSTPEVPISLPLQEPVQTFSKSDIEAIEAAYIGEKPPFDGHRRQILDPHHNFVGIGLGRATDGKAICLANTQEFVDRYLVVNPIAQSAKAGERLVISGQATAKKPLYAIAVGREELPVAKTRDEVQRYRSYSLPPADAWLFAGRDFEVSKDGKFEAKYAFPKGERGLYYIMIWVRNDPKQTGTQGLFIASCRTVVVE